MDRQIIYVGQIPQDTDQLLQNKNVMIGLGYLIQAILGPSTVVDGLACTATLPAGLTVNVAPGSIYAIENVDNSAYGSVEADTTHQIMKQGIVMGTTNLSCPAPSTTGFSINYLVEAAYEDSDGGSEVLPYYNASDPSQAYNGPNNSGTSQNTVRQGICAVQVKAGIAATTGTQTTPSPDAGFVGLFVVTVANGQTTITSGNISVYSGAPFIGTKLPNIGVLASLGIGAGLTSSGGNLIALAQRPTLTANRTYFVSTSGSDSNNGLTSGTAFQTIQKAVNTAQSVDLNGFSVTISLADGTYTSGVAISAPFTGNGNVTLVGDTGTPDNCIISTTSSDCISVQNAFLFLGGGYKLQTTTSGNAINVGNGANVTINGSIDFGAMATGGRHILAGPGAVINVTSSYTITGGGGAHYEGDGGTILVSSPTITLSGTPAFTDFAASSFGDISVRSSVTTFSGSATGVRYSAVLNGIINTNSSGSTYLPGSSSGSVASGGQYI